MTSTANYDREEIRRAVEITTGEALSVNDPLPDVLIVAAQTIGVKPAALRLWIHESQNWHWTAATMAAWAREKGLCDPNAPDPPEPVVCIHCRNAVVDAARHQCQPRQTAPQEIRLHFDLSEIRPGRRGPIWAKLAELFSAIAEASGEERQQ